MFQLLCKDILLYLINKLIDPGPLFCSCKYLNDFGKRFSLRAHEICIKKIKEISPYSSILDSPQEQLSLIKRGQETVYTVHLEYMEDPDEYSRNRTYKLGKLELGRNIKINYDGKIPLLFLKGSPTNFTSLSIFGLAKDTSCIKSDEASIWEVNSSEFEFEIISEDELGKKESVIWNFFCRAAVRSEYLKFKNNLENEQFIDRSKITELLGEIRTQESEKEREMIKNMNQDEINEYYRDKNRNRDFNDLYPGTNYSLICAELRELDQRHKMEIIKLKAKIYSNSEEIIMRYRMELIKNKTYNGYVFDTIGITNRLL